MNSVTRLLTHLAQEDVVSSAGTMFGPEDIRHLTNSLVYTGLGVAVFAAAFFLMAKVIPFSVRKEIEEDQNTALGIIMGSVIIGLAIIIAAAIGG